MNPRTGHADPRDPCWPNQRRKAQVLRVHFALSMPSKDVFYAPIE